MSIKDLIGKVVKTDIGELKIKAVKYAGLKTGPNLEVTKCVEIETECGEKFSSTMKDLEAAAV